MEAPTAVALPGHTVLLRHAVLLRWYAAQVASLVPPLARLSGQSPLRARFDGWVLGWRRALAAAADTLGQQAAWLNGLDAGPTTALLPPFPLLPPRFVVPRFVVPQVPIRQPRGAIVIDPGALAAAAGLARAAGDRAGALAPAVAAAIVAAAQAAARDGFVPAAAIRRAGDEQAAVLHRRVRTFALEAAAAAAELERRLTELAHVPTTLRRASSPSPSSPPPPLAVAAGMLAVLGGADAGRAPDAAELRGIRVRLAGLSVPAREGVIAALRGEPLAVLARAAERLTAAPAPGTMDAAAELAGLADDLLAGAPRDLVDDLVRELPWLEPAAPAPSPPGPGGAPRRVVALDRTGDPLIRGGPGPDDVGQGAVADCYLAAALIGIAHQDPDRIIAGLRRNPNGTVTVLLHPAGGPARPVTVTAVLPSYRDPGGGRPQEVGMDGDDAADLPELWPALYEKAYARLRGGYPAIGFGSAAEGLRMITGRPAARRRAGGTDAAALAALLGRGEVVTVTTRGHTGRRGMVPSHAYAVLAVDVPRGRVLLRNPWDPPAGSDGQRWYDWSAVVPDAAAVVHGPAW